MPEPVVSVIDRCAGGERDLEEENLRGNLVRLHQTRLGSSQVTGRCRLLRETSPPQ